ncbi:MAG: hypothetical protein R3B72_15245 [Polyangiaceae bacterium]
MAHRPDLVARRSVLLGFLGALLLSACTPAAVPADPPAEASCRKRRAAFDIGSGTTKMKVADVDLCHRRLLAIHLAEDAPVFYGLDVSTHPPHFRDTTMERGFATLEDFRRRAESLEPEAYAAVATAAFRKADNAGPFIARIEQELGITVNLIAQAEEARLGFLGAVTKAGVDPERAVVWDVGGASMQMTTLGTDGHLDIYAGDFASSQMRSYILTALQAKSGDAETSPNPMSEEQAEAARRHARSYAEAHVPSAIRDKLAEPGTVVIGLGALKYYGDRPASEVGASCNLQHLSVRVDDLLGLEDAAIGGAYAANQVSDRLLLLGFMEAMDVAEVILADADLTDGLLFERELWAGRAATR